MYDIFWIQFDVYGNNLADICPAQQEELMSHNDDRVTFEIEDRVIFLCAQSKHEYVVRRVASWVRLWLNANGLYYKERNGLGGAV